ncbi:hypothetical protein K439DRAFT_1327816 [Ramaria rubella]|nr:hypothetical protein K439DRAFT_1327816 [Ramaria rubella]
MQTGRYQQPPHSQAPQHGNGVAGGHRAIAPAPPAPVAGPSTLYSQSKPRAEAPYTHLRPTKRLRTTPPPFTNPTPHPNSHPHPHNHTNPHPSRTPSPPIPPTKSTLLSAQQKKANHIQSEQKRRANIRKGYEALCETVPALREAIREEEGSGANIIVNGSGGGKKKRGRGDEGEKIDGRAGPRSESVVLQKTIEHIQALLDEKATLLARLDHARTVLGPGHPAAYSDISLGQAPWERDWDGGKGLIDPDGEHEQEHESDYD